MNAIPVKSTLEKMVEALTKNKPDCVVLTPVKEDPTLSIAVNRTISLEQMVSLVNDVVECVFNVRVLNDEISYQTENYVSGIEDFYTKKAILRYYTDLELSYVENDFCIKLFYDTPIYKEVRENISHEQLMVVLKAIKDGIDLKKSQLISGHEARMEDNLRQLEQCTAAMGSFLQNMDGKDMKSFAAAAENFSQKSEKEIVNNVLQFRAEEATD